MSEQCEAGKRWIKSQFHETARELGIPLDGLEWKQSTEDFDHLRLSLVYDIAGTRHVEKFSRMEIDFSAGDPAVQVTLKTRITKLLESFSPRPRRIGF